RPQAEVERPIPGSVYAFGGLASAALLGSLVLGAVASGDYSSSGCSAGCASNVASRVRNEQRATDIVLTAGVLSAGVALFLYLARPTKVVASTAAGSPVDLRF